MTSKIRQHVHRPRAMHRLVVNNWAYLMVLVGCFAVAFTGCKSIGKSEFKSELQQNLITPASQVQQVTYDSVDSQSATPDYSHFEPRVIGKTLPTEFWNLTLGEAIEIGLSNTKIIRSLGGQILRNPDSANSVFQPALTATDPIRGIDASLSSFDAQLQSNVSLQKNDDVFNNQAIGGGANEVKQSLFGFDSQISKIGATGTQYTIRSLTQHDGNNSPGVLFNHSWQTFLEAGVRQPLLQGRGLDFNRIAGPNGQPGIRFSNGVVIAQLDTQISVSAFEQGIQDFVLELTNTYWQLYLAYRNYETTLQARDIAYKTWRTIEARFDNELPGGEADKEAQARERLFLFERDLTLSLGGTQASGQPGVYQLEANLRRLMGISNAEGNFIRPVEEPFEGKVLYDWSNLVNDALNQRIELRQQKIRVQRREMELYAAKNFLRPRLDAIATSRVNGFGDDLAFGENIGAPNQRFNSAAKDFFSGNHIEWEFGLQLNAPIGLRREYAAKKNAEITLRREMAVLRDQEHEVLYSLGNAYRQVSTQYEAMKEIYNRMVASTQTLEARTVAFEADQTSAEFLLDAQQTKAQAENDYHRARIEYALARNQLLVETGSFLQNFGVNIRSEDESNYQASAVIEQTPVETQTNEELPAESLPETPALPTPVPTPNPQTEQAPSELKLLPNRTSQSSQTSVESLPAVAGPTFSPQVVNQIETYPTSNTLPNTNQIRNAPVKTSEPVSNPTPDPNDWMSVPAVDPDLGNNFGGNQSKTLDSSDKKSNEVATKEEFAVSALEVIEFK